jgi:hypothetical protein
MAREKPMSANVASLISVLLIRYLKSPEDEEASIDVLRANANFLKRKKALMHSISAIELK